MALHEALGGLPELDREVIRLWAWERLEPREIAEVVDATPNAVSIRLTRIRHHLSAALARKDRGPAGHRMGEGNPEQGP